MIRRFFFATFAAIAAVAALAPAHAQGRAAVGTLECRSPGKISLIVSVTDYDCVFFSVSGHAYRYAGRVASLGLQAGVTNHEVLVWRVFAPTVAPDRDALRGNYAGAHAGAAVVLGLGANALFGGSDWTISLQPISVEAKTGINVALAGSALTLY